MCEVKKANSSTAPGCRAKKSNSVWKRSSVIQCATAIRNATSGIRVCVLCTWLLRSVAKDSTPPCRQCSL